MPTAKNKQTRSGAPLGLGFFSDIPKGGIIAWYAQAGNIPDGWAICDGSNNTPDLRSRFIYGVADIASIGGTGGAYSIQHTFHGSGSGSGTCSASGTTEDCRANPDAWGKTDLSRSQTPQCGGLDHKHGVQVSGNVSVSVNVTGITDTKPLLPPYVGLVFLMKK